MAAQLPNFDDSETLATLRVNRADLLLRRGAADEAMDLYRTAIVFDSRLGNPLGVADGADGLVEALIQQGNYRAAAKLFGAGEELREKRRLPRKMAEEQYFYEALRLGEEALGSTLWNEIVAAGRSLGLDALVELALQPISEG